MRYLPKYCIDAYEIELFMLNFHMTKTEFCKECKISKRELSKILDTAHLNFKLDTLMRIANLMNIEYCKLLSERKQKHTL
ncbi:MAG: hypothetical protein J6J24_02105 [Clostridia bacterium]|nr:hypothetical protein [Clostridia bacterium]